MATALAKGFVRSGLVTPESLLASDPAEDACRAFATETGGRTTSFNPDVAKFARVLFLAVKPDQAVRVLTEVREHLSDAQVLVSIAAGVTLSRLQEAVKEGTRVVRVMPNTPALVGCSATAFALGESAQPQDAEMVQGLFGSVGVAFQVKEALLDAVTGLSGSGPAYGYLLIEALSDGGVAAGLPRAIAIKLAAQTMLGAAKMVLETGLHPGALKDMVASPGGTTIEGLHVLEQAAVRGALIDAVRAAAEKSRKLGQK